MRLDLIEGAATEGGVQERREAETHFRRGQVLGGNQKWQEPHRPRDQTLAIAISFTEMLQIQYTK